MLALAHLPLVSAAGDATTKKSSGASGFVLIGIVVVVLLFLVVNGRRRAKTAQAQQEQTLVVGSTVVTRAGLIATLVERSDDEVVLEIAPGVRARFVPQAIGRVLEPADAAADEVVDSDAVEPAVKDPDQAAEDGHAG